MEYGFESHYPPDFNNPRKCLNTGFRGFLILTWDNYFYNVFTRFITPSYTKVVTKWSRSEKWSRDKNGHKKRGRKTHYPIICLKGN